MQICIEFGFTKGKDPLWIPLSVLMTCVLTDTIMIINNSRKNYMHIVDNLGEKIRQCKNEIHLTTIEMTH